MTHYELSVEVGPTRMKFCVDAAAAPKAGDQLVYMDGKEQKTMTLPFAVVSTRSDAGCSKTWGKAATLVPK